MITSVEDANIVFLSIHQMIGRGGGMVTGKEFTVIVIPPRKMASSLVIIGNRGVIACNTVYSNQSICQVTGRVESKEDLDDANSDDGW